MEDSRRLILFFIILLVWFLGIQFYIARRRADRTPPPPPPVTAGEEATAPGEAAPPAPVAAGPVAAAPAAPVAAVGTAAAAETVLLETGTGPDDGYLVRMTSRGAAVIDLVRKDFSADKNAPDVKLTLLDSTRTGLAALAVSGLTLRPGDAPVPQPCLDEPLESRIWRITERAGDRVVFETDLSPGVTLRKAVVYDAVRDGFTVILTQTNTSPERLRTGFDLLGSPGVVPEKTEKVIASLEVRAAVIREDRLDVKRYQYPTVKKDPVIREDGQFAWVAGQNKYFAVILKLLPGANNPVVVPVISGIAGPVPDGVKAKEATNLAAYARVAGFDTPAGGTAELSFTFHAIPKRKDDLTRAELDQRDVVSYGFGWIRAISEFLLFILIAIHKVLPNWGVAIIVLTCVVSAVLHPLNRKGQVSMYKMQKIQPLIKELNQKFKNNKQKKNEEYMKLLHKHGVNPAGGCLPMLVQMPVLFALYFALQSSFYLRQSGFLWIDDLSNPDALFSLPFTFISSFNLLPILMSVAMYVQQKLTPSTSVKPAPGEPPSTQQQMEGMMKIMPWIMLVFFYTMPAGLILYWLTSNIIRIFETYYFRYKLVPAIEAAVLRSAAEAGE